MFCEDQGIEVIKLGLESHDNPWDPISEEVGSNGLEGLKL